MLKCICCLHMHMCRWRCINENDKNPLTNPEWIDSSELIVYKEHRIYVTLILFVTQWMKFRD